MKTRLLACVAVAALLAAGCSPGDAVPTAEGPAADATAAASDALRSPEVEVDSYVALGDSFTAGPLIPTTDLAGGCFRSDSNYPALVAEQLDIPEVRDVSCAGATTRDLTSPQRTVEDARVRPQLAALTKDTDLVTLGIGGNDFDLFSTVVQTCTRLRDADPGGAPCADELASRGIDVQRATQQIAGRVADAVRAIRQRAPEARVVLVGYLRLAPSTGQCPELPFARGDYVQGVAVSQALNDALAAAARRTGASFVDMYAASEGHDICSEKPWVNGVHTVKGRALAYHPLAEGMEATAERVVAALEG